MLHDRDLARQAIERRFIELAFAVGLLGLRFRAIEVAHDFRDRDDVARIDLGFVFLGAARPHGALDAGAALQGLQRLLHQRGLGELAHADIGDLRGRHPQRHLVLHEVDDEQLEPGAGDLLLLDGQDLANAVGGIDHEFIGLEPLTLGHDLLFLDARGAATGLAAGAAGLTGAFGAALFGEPSRQPSQPWSSRQSLSRQSWQSLGGIALLLFLEDFAAGSPCRRTGYPGHGSWMRYGWPRRLFSRA